MLRPFEPSGAGPQTRAFAATTASQRLAAWWPVPAQQLLVTNAGPGVVAVAWGVASQAGTLAAALPTTAGALGDTVLLPGQSMTFSCSQAAVVAVVSDAATATVYIEPGEGV